MQECLRLAGQITCAWLGHCTVCVGPYISKEPTRKDGADKWRMDLKIIFIDFAAKNVNGGGIGVLLLERVLGDIYVCH